jgi:hypothetical protein
VLEGVLNAQFDKEELNSVRREMQTLAEQMNLRLDANERLVHTHKNMLRRELDDLKEFSRISVQSVREEMRIMFAQQQQVMQQQQQAANSRRSDADNELLSGDAHTELLLLRRRVEELEDRVDSMGNAVVGVEDTMNAGFQSLAGSLAQAQTHSDMCVQSLTAQMQTTKQTLEQEIEEVVVNIGRALRALQQTQTQNSVSVSRQIQLSQTQSHPHSSQAESKSESESNKQSSSLAALLASSGSSDFHAETAAAAVAQILATPMRASSAHKQLATPSIKAQTPAQVTSPSPSPQQQQVAEHSPERPQEAVIAAATDDEDDLDDVITMERIVAINYVIDHVLSDDIVKRVARRLAVQSYKQLLRKQQQTQQQAQSQSAAVASAETVTPSNSVVAADVVAGVETLPLSAQSPVGSSTKLQMPLASESAGVEDAVNIASARGAETDTVPAEHNIVDQTTNPPEEDTLESDSLDGGEAPIVDDEALQSTDGGSNEGAEDTLVQQQVSSPDEESAQQETGEEADDGADGQDLIPAEDSGLGIRDNDEEDDPEGEREGEADGNGGVGTEGEGDIGNDDEEPANSRDTDVDNDEQGLADADEGASPIMDADDVPVDNGAAEDSDLHEQPEDGEPRNDEPEEVEAMNTAATRIQSIMRGASSRTLVNAKKQEVVQKTIRSNAATAIQAQARGMVTRKQSKLFTADESNEELTK